MRIFGALVAAFLAAGCATVIRGYDDEVTVNTTPDGAAIAFSDGQNCTTPCTLTAKRNEALQLTITKAGCHTHTATLTPTLSGAGIILGGLIDFGTGAVYDLQPNPLTVTMVCDEQ